MIEINAKLVREQKTFFLCGEIVECFISFSHPTLPEHKIAQSNKYASATQKYISFDPSHQINLRHDNPLWISIIVNLGWRIWLGQRHKFIAIVPEPMTTNQSIRPQRNQHKNRMLFYRLRLHWTRNRAKAIRFSKLNRKSFSVIYDYRPAKRNHVSRTRSACLALEINFRFIPIFRFRFIQRDATNVRPAHISWH